MKIKFDNFSSLFGIIVISIGAFFGFGSIFNYLEIGVGVQAITAAFGALFIILSTKFLMETESSSSLKREKDRLIFNECLREYKELSFLMVEILEDSQLTLTEINKLRQKHAQLILLGSFKAIKSSRDFLEMCLEIFSKEVDEEIKNIDSQDEVKISLDKENQKKLWGKALEYINYARVGLNLDEKEIQFKQEKDSFEQIVEKLNGAKKKEKDGINNARTPLKGGLKQYISNRKISDQDKKDFKDFISLLENTCNLEAKYTRSVISFREENKNSVVFYVGKIKEGKINAGFPHRYVDKSDSFWDNLSSELQDFSPIFDEQKSKSKGEKIYGSISCTFRKEHLTETKIKPLEHAIKQFSDRFKLK